MVPKLTRKHPGRLPGATRDEETGKEANDPAARKFCLTDLGNAERFVAQHLGKVHFIREDKVWMAWDGARWRVNAAEILQGMVKDTINSIEDEADATDDAKEVKEVRSHALKSQCRTRIDAMLALAEREPGVAISKETLDNDDMLLGVQNGVIDLRTGGFRCSRPEDRITRSSQAEFDAEADCPTWELFLSTMFAGDMGVIAYIQRVVGYILTGSFSERAFFLFHGAEGGNGKTTFVEILRALLGSYSLQAQPETFMTSKWSRGVRNDIARLAQARFVAATESDEGQRLAEGLVKAVTGGDTVTSRFLFQEHVEFTPKFKLLLATNYLPDIKGTDPAIWGRVHVVPCRVSVPLEQRDKTLRGKLRAELSGILNWAIQGCLQWQQVGLQPPEVILSAKEAYRGETDFVGRWLAERCELAPGARTQATPLHEDYIRWTSAQNEEALSQRSFGLRLKTKVPSGKSNNYYYEVRLRFTTDDSMSEL